SSPEGHGGEFCAEAGSGQTSDAETTARARRTRGMMSSPESRRGAKPAAGEVGRLARFFPPDPPLGVQNPAKSGRRPTTRLIPIGSPNVSAPTAEANTGLIVMVMAVRVGVVRSSANTQRKKAAAPPNTPR